MHRRGGRREGSDAEAGVRERTTEESDGREKSTRQFSTRKGRGVLGQQQHAGRRTSGTVCGARIAVSREQHKLVSGGKLSCCILLCDTERAGGSGGSESGWWEASSVEYAAGAQASALLDEVHFHRQTHARTHAEQSARAKGRQEKEGNDGRQVTQKGVSAEEGGVLWKHCSGWRQ